MAIILGILFLTFSIVGVLFIERELTWQLYTLSKALPATKWVQIIIAKKFATAALNQTKEDFIVYIAFFKGKMMIYLAYDAQIALLMAKKVIVSTKYSDFTEFF